MKITRAWLIDTGERAGTAYAAAFLGLWFAPVLAAFGNGGDVPTAVHGVLILSVASKAAIGAVPAALIVLKSAFAPLLRRKRGDSMSPASLAGAVQPQQALEGAPPSPPRRRARGDSGLGEIAWLVLVFFIVLLVLLAFGR